MIVVKDGCEISPHVQPGLEEGDPPLSLVWAIRPNPTWGRGCEIADLGRNLIAAYYQSLRDEGFPEENIELAETIVDERCKGCEWRLMPLNEINFHHHT